MDLKVLMKLLEMLKPNSYHRWGWQSREEVVREESELLLVGPQ